VKPDKRTERACRGEALEAILCERKENPRRQLHKAFSREPAAVWQQKTIILTGSPLVSLARDDEVNNLWCIYFQNIIIVKKRHLLNMQESAILIMMI